MAEIQRNSRFLDTCIFGVLDRSGNNDVRLVPDLFCRNVVFNRMRGFDTGADSVPCRLRYILPGCECRTVAFDGFRRTVARSQFGRIPSGERQFVARPRIILIKEEARLLRFFDYLRAGLGQLTVEIERTVAVCHDIEAVCVLFHRILVGNATARRLGYGGRKRDVIQTFGIGVGADRFVLRAGCKGSCYSNR